MQKKIAVLGSSGGNLYNQGGNDPKKLLAEIFTQADSAGICVGFVQFVATGATMDRIAETSPASLYTLQNGALAGGAEDELKAVNAQAAEFDKQAAALIEGGEIDGLVLMSCDPIGANRLAVEAAAKTKIPVVGTGGSSMATVRAKGCNVVSASGTTGTTNRTRAVSFISALAGEWGVKYTPVIGSSATGGSVGGGNVLKRINFRGIMMAAMPGFIAMALCLALGRILGIESLENVFSTLVGALPVILAAIAAKQVSGLDEVGIVAGIVAGFMSVDGGIIGGLVTGILAGVLAYYIITLCFKYKVPGTTANIAAGGLSGLIAGFVGMYLIAPVALFVGDGIKGLIEMALDYNAILAGALAGFAIWFAIIAGVYHAAILPIVLLEMETTGYSFLGSIDMCGLVLVCAGIMLANIFVPRQKADPAVAVSGIVVNLAFGTFVEAAYPFMFSDKKVFGSAVLAATVSGALVGALGVRGTAYVPTFMAPGLAPEGKALASAICMVVALLVAFVLTAACNLMERRKTAAGEAAGKEVA